MKKTCTFVRRRHHKLFDSESICRKFYLLSLPSTLRAHKICSYFSIVLSCGASYLAGYIDSVLKTAQLRFYWKIENIS